MIQSEPPIWQAIGPVSSKTPYGYLGEFKAGERVDIGLGALVSCSIPLHFGYTCIILCCVCFAFKAFLSYQICFELYALVGNSTLSAPFLVCRIRKAWKSPTPELQATFPRAWRLTLKPEVLLALRLTPTPPIFLPSGLRMGTASTQITGLELSLEVSRNKIFIRYNKHYISSRWSPRLVVLSHQWTTLDMSLFLW